MFQQVSKILISKASKALIPSQIYLLIGKLYYHSPLSCKTHLAIPMLAIFFVVVCCGWLLMLFAVAGCCQLLRLAFVAIFFYDKTRNI